MADYRTYVDYIYRLLKALNQDLVLTEDTDLIEEAGLKSLQVMELIVEIEDQFDISVPLNVLPDIRTVRDLARELEKLDS